MKSFGKTFFIAITMFFCSILLHGQPAPVPQYHVKALFLYNFTQFVEWPAAKFADANAPFIIGVLGDNVFGTYLEDAVRREKINGHPMVLKYYNEPSEIQQCHILFINSNEANRADLSLSNLKERGILTVSDADLFARKGGIIAFFNENNKIRFRINLEAAKEANLKLSSKLLRLAQITDGKNS